MPKILIVEDDVSLVKLYESILQPKYQLFVTKNGDQLRKELEKFRPDLIILDVDLGTYKNGFDLAVELQKNEDLKRIPILFVTAQNSPDSLARAFRVGAEDYLAKPFQPYELLARVDHRIQKAKAAFEENRYLIFGNLRLDIIKHLCFDSDVLIDLSPAEFQVLLFLVKNSGRTIARKELTVDALGERDLSPRLVDSYVSTLRKKLPSLKNRIESIYAVGYCLKTEGDETPAGLASSRIGDS